MKRTGPLKSKINWDSTLNLPKTSLSIKPLLNDELYKEKISTELYKQLASRQNAPEFNLTDGPPFANGDLHVGHALNKLLKDTILRVKGQQGYTINFRPAWDCHGLPIELKALQHSKSSRITDPIEIRALCKNFALEAIEKQKRSMQKWGIMADYSRPLLTIDPEFEANQLQVLAAMVDKNLIYSTKKPVFYSPSSQTALAEAELEYRDDHVSLTALIRFKAQLCDQLRSKLPDQSLQVSFITWTTTPWTLPSNKALAVGKDIVYSLAYSSVTREYVIVARSRIASICTTLQHSLDTIISDFCKGSDLSTCHYEGLQLSYSTPASSNPVLIADFVSDDSGSGIVHLAPDYGTDDFEACKAVGIEPNTNDLLNDNGEFTNAAPSFLTGLNIFSGASETILEYLKYTGNCLASYYYAHRFPYDWRSKKPVIQRATRQWFASISSIMPQLQSSLEQVRFFPASGKDKMMTMLAGRTDWCISRQRHWGLAIPALRSKQNDHSLLDSPVIRSVSNLIRADPSGSNIWWTRPLSDLLPKNFNPEQYTKTFDTLDVWFDSGSVWCNNNSVADLYLEGSDQYRGWFQSSLITSVAVKGIAPYKAVLTHGFVLDQKGQKMSKSVGNVVDPDEIVNKHGSDVLRLWVASSNYKMDVNIGPEVIKQVVENKRKIRNTLRFILGNLNGFGAEPEREFRWIDRLMLGKVDSFKDSCQKSVDSYDFPAVIQQLSQFCVNNLSAFYFEILKDRFYTEPLESSLRQGAQFVLIRILNALLEVISPIMPILAEEIRSQIPCIRSDIQDHTTHNTQNEQQLDWIHKKRNEFLEWFNTSGKRDLQVKSTFQLDLCINQPPQGLTSEELREIFSVASVEVSEGDKFEITSIKASDRMKCPRCWTFDSQSSDELCPRCVSQTIEYNLKAIKL